MIVSSELAVGFVVQIFVEFVKSSRMETDGSFVLGGSRKLRCVCAAEDHLVQLEHVCRRLLASVFVCASGFFWATPAYAGVYVSEDSFVRQEHVRRRHLPREIPRLRIGDDEAGHHLRSRKEYTHDLRRSGFR